MGRVLIPDPLGCRSSDERNNANLMDLGSVIMRKNQRSAASLYIAPGFAHMRSIVSAYGLI